MIESVLGTGFKYLVEVEKNGVVVDSWWEHNIMPQESVDHIASLIRGGGASPISNWYVGIFESDYVPDETTTAGDLQNDAGESTAYDESTRPIWDNSYDGESLIANGSSRAEFTMNASKNIYGAFIVSSQTKGGTGGTLLSIARFSSPREVEPGSVLRITAGIVLTPTGQL